MQNITIRIADENDYKDITELILDTDEYIYPPMFTNRLDEAITFFKECLKDEMSIFFHKRILVAINEQSNKIIGILVFFLSNQQLKLKSSIDVNLQSIENILICSNQYFKPLIDEYVNVIDVAYISNICVSKNIRNQGIGNVLLNSFYKYLQNNYRSISSVELDVLCNNDAAIYLYKKNGFKILYSEDAFSLPKIENLKSFRMKKNL